MSKRSVVATMLRASGLLDIEPPGRRHRLVLLAYHRVCAYDPASYPLDDELVSALPEAFDAQMRWVKSHYDVLSFKELLEASSAGHLPERPLIVTFDDGYRDNHDVALAVLERHGIGATVFLTTAPIDEGELFWFDLVAGWIKRTRARRLELRASTSHVFIIGDHRGPVIRAVQDCLKEVDDLTHADLMQQLRDQTGAPIEDIDGAGPLSWEQVRHMYTRGIEFGSHTVGHFNLARLPPKRLDDELRQSKARIEAELASPVISLAYPFGTARAYNSAVEEAARRAGYRFAVTYGGTVNDATAFEAFAIQRIAVERDTTYDLFRAQLHFPRFLRSR